MEHSGLLPPIAWEREKGIICLNFLSSRNNIYKIEGDFRAHLFPWFTVPTLLTSFSNQFYFQQSRKQPQFYLKSLKTNPFFLCLWVPSSKKKRFNFCIACLWNNNSDLWIVRLDSSFFPSHLPNPCIPCKCKKHTDSSWSPFLGTPFTASSPKLSYP